MALKYRLLYLEQSKLMSNNIMANAGCFYRLIKRGKRYAIVLLFILLAGCQTVPKKQASASHSESNSESKYSHYYLTIKALDDLEVEQEVARQQVNKKSVDIAQMMQWIILYSLPNSPEHNPYTAKAQLNRLSLSLDNTPPFSTADLAFFVMLKDQLNQQLLQLEKIKNYKGAYQQSKKVLTTQQQQINQLEQQLSQLKKIEQTISERDKND